MAGGVTPRDVYTALTSAGASTTQAIGIMANAINESSLNPEAINKSDPNGGSFGFVQENGSQYASLVTGYPATDLIAQVKVLAQNGGFRAASGATPAEAAGNFAANYEKCTGCQPGGQQYSSRVGNAATVAGWVKAGNFPQSAGSPSAGSGGSGSSGGGGSSPCVVQFPGVAGVGSFCVLSQTQARAAVGALLLVAGAGPALVGVLILVAVGLKATGAQKALSTAAQFTPVGRGVGVASKAAGAPAKAAARGGGRRAAGRAETQELSARGASDLRAADRSRQASPRPRPPVSPGRKTGSVDARRGADIPPF
jgi:hypothetical protein